MSLRALRNLMIAFFFGVLIVWIALERMTAPKKITIGIACWVTNAEYDRNISAFKEALARHGFIENKDIQYIIESANLNAENQRKIIQEFIRKKVDLIYSLTTPGTLIAKEMTQAIPIVFSIVTYPVEAQVIGSLARSGNNLVGTRNYIPMIRQFNVFKSLYPQVKNIGFVHRKDEPNSMIQLVEFRKILNSTGINVTEINPVRVEEVASRLNALKGKIDALYSACDTLVQGGGEEIIIAFAKENRLPDFTCNKSGVKKGSLIGNISDFSYIGGLAGKKAGQILKGTSPGNLKTECPEEDYIMLNMTRVEELGLKPDPSFIETVSELIR